MAINSSYFESHTSDHRYWFGQINRGFAVCSNKEVTLFRDHVCMFFPSTKK
jgi:hypothetical protein